MTQEAKSPNDPVMDWTPHAPGLQNIAVLIPCLNEAVSISAVITAFKEEFPHAAIYVYDNNSTDGTADEARRNGAIVRHEPQQGKGHVVRRMFADVEADVYLLVDGDGTYCAEDAPTMVEALLNQRLDMVVANRSTAAIDSYRFGHQTGNRMFTGIVGWIFGRRVNDILSGYRIFSRRFVKSFPALSTGFEIETELTVHALSLNIPVGEVSSRYFARPPASTSKLRTFKDGFRILLLILLLTKSERPMLFFSVIFSVFAAVSLALGIPVILEWLETRLVPRLPTALLSASMMIIGFLSLTNGFVLSSFARNQREVKRMQYLNLPWLGQSLPLPKDRPPH